MAAIATITTNNNNNINNNYDYNIKKEYTPFSVATADFGVDDIVAELSGPRCKIDICDFFFNKIGGIMSQLDYFISRSELFMHSYYVPTMESYMVMWTIFVLLMHRIIK